MATTNFRGRITRLFVHKDATFIRLDLPAAQQPLDSEFRLMLNHKNYNSVYSIVLAAAINRYEIRIRTTAPINPGDRAEVWYVVVNWA